MGTLFTRTENWKISGRSLQYQTSAFPIDYGTQRPLVSFASCHRILKYAESMRNKSLLPPWLSPVNQWTATAGKAALPKSSPLQISPSQDSHRSSPPKTQLISPSRGRICLHKCPWSYLGCWLLPWNLTQHKASSTCRCSSQWDGWGRSRE